MAGDARTATRMERRRGDGRQRGTHRDVVVEQRRRVLGHLPQDEDGSETPRLDALVLEPLERTRDLELDEVGGHGAARAREVAQRLARELQRVGVSGGGRKHASQAVREADDLRLVLLDRDVDQLVDDEDAAELLVVLRRVGELDGTTVYKERQRARRRTQTRRRPDSHARVGPRCTRHTRQ
jgi:hypothetical protein